MDKLIYAKKMIEYHSRLLIKWTKYIDKNYSFQKDKQKEECEIPDGQLDIYEIMEVKDEL